MVHVKKKQIGPDVRSAGDNGRLFAKDVAAVLCISRRMAEKHLVALEEAHGARVVARTGRGQIRPRRYTTMAALDAVTPRHHSENEGLRARVHALEQRVEQLETSLANAWRRLDESVSRHRRQAR
jgi:predicted ArsR family transcriptional regulator